MIGTVYELLRKPGLLPTVDVRPVNIIEGLAKVLSSEEAESEVGTDFALLDP
ncbi:hypothetical protein B0H12DRAFT_1161221, partial [Mycena haematopus]